VAGHPQMYYAQGAHRRERMPASTHARRGITVLALVLLIIAVAIAAILLTRTLRA
jgi:hypothetical protein